MDEKNSDPKPTVSVLFTELRDPVTQELYGVIAVYRLDGERQARFVKRDPETKQVVFCDPPAIFTQHQDMLEELKGKLLADNIILQTPSVLMIANTGDNEKPRHLN